MRTAADIFLSGKPVVYTGFDGRVCIGKFANGERNSLGAPTLTISRTGEEDREVLMSEQRARIFFWSLDLEAES